MPHDVHASVWLLFQIKDVSENQHQLVLADLAPLVDPRVIIVGAGLAGLAAAAALQVSHFEPESACSWLV